MIVVQQVDQIEVFFNKTGGITIRQGGENDEYLVCFPLEAANAVIAGIKQAVKDAKGE